MPTCIFRLPNVPRYIYSGRVGEKYLRDFENLYFNDIENYPTDFFKSREMRDMALRIAHVFFKSLNDQMERDQNNRQYIKPSFQKLGDKGFDWPVILSMLNRESTIICAGIGTNITFEALLADKTSANIHLFDPSKHAINHFNNFYQNNPQLILNQLGLSNTSGVVKFFKDENPEVGSLSAANLSHSSTFFELPVTTIDGYLKSINKGRVDYLKMDIEGAEYGVIERLLQFGIEVDQLAFEFDQPIPPWRSLKLINKLALFGFHPCLFWGTNGYFVHERVVSHHSLKSNLAEES